MSLMFDDLVDRPRPAAQGKSGSVTPRLTRILTGSDLGVIAGFSDLAMVVWRLVMRADHLEVSWVSDHLGRRL
jgi:hypothetical protein